MHYMEYFNENYVLSLLRFFNLHFKFQLNEAFCITIPCLKFECFVPCAACRENYWISLHVICSINGFKNKTKNPVTLANPFRRTEGSLAPCAIQLKLLEQVL